MNDNKRALLDHRNTSLPGVHLRGGRVPLAVPLLPPAPLPVGAAALDAAPVVEPAVEPGPDAAVEGRVGAADREPAAAVDGRTLAVPGLPPADADVMAAPVEDDKVSPPASESIMGTKSTRRFFTAPFDRAGNLTMAAKRNGTMKK
jgi:hypothetical protein